MGCGCVTWWTYLAPWVKGLIVTVLQNFVNLTLCQWDREQTWAILYCGLPLGGPSGLKFLLYKTMDLGIPLLKFQGLGSIYVERVAIWNFALVLWLWLFGLDLDVFVGLLILAVNLLPGDPDNWSSWSLLLGYLRVYLHWWDDRSVQPLWSWCFLPRGGGFYSLWIGDPDVRFPWLLQDY